MSAGPVVAGGPIAPRERGSFVAAPGGGEAWGTLCAPARTMIVAGNRYGDASVSVPEEEDASGLAAVVCACRAARG